MEVIEKTDRFTLIGPSFSHGKITLLDSTSSERPRADQLFSIQLAESKGVEHAPVTLECGVVITTTPFDVLGIDDPEFPRHAVVGVSLRCVDPPIAAARFAAEHDMAVDSVRPDVAVVDVGQGTADGRIVLLRERAEPGDEPVLDHIGIRVGNAAARRDQIAERDIEVLRWVEAPNSNAAFVSGPDGVVLEYVEHTNSLFGVS
jgi:hypothetical protein